MKEYTYNINIKVIVWYDPPVKMERVTFRIANVFKDGKIILSFD
jgi:hypothetical protein